mmetsp:Transcript_9894/g.24731  ORF Transcript_9894/g.24731 Transcript_9894/m.24731 type:complete len:118 (-) Transcript_9894:468-821(-)|eukprot:CAMPEP_0202865372 /NCGR_PEP_ID=MMETSP1391-20130828/5851_1 /ASSEMBLY_ACC=CAM_ASM_000867 /TAXON_ID=1034604 /ORGANISM="Chlamydomonas leiostraca, Strain SAG 11-49" /LENGTH=117 /DNA_ID=CAMNT_0049545211 /DNA_START=79 /DNA_END=432 /DNA_ORIENTATION=-
MAKSARSNAKKALRTWRRENLTAKWQDESDNRRYEALAAIAAAPKPEPPPKAESEDASDMEEDRGRTGKMETDPQPSKKKGKKAGVKVGVGKKRRAGKLFLIGKNQFHKKKGKKGTR